MRAPLSLSVALALSVATMAVSAAPAQAEAASCDSFHANATLPALVVASGARCVLNASTVQGRVLVQPGGLLLAFQGTVIQGDVVARQSTVQINTGSSVQGNVVTMSPVSFDGAVSVALCGIDVGGSVVIWGARGQNRIDIGGPVCAIKGGGNTIGANIVDANNQGTLENVIEGNRIGATLACSDNAPAPTGGANTARASVGQCAQMASVTRGRP